MAGFIRKIGHKLSHRIQRDVGHLALLFVGQEGVAEGFLFGVLGKEAGERVGADVASGFHFYGQGLCIGLYEEVDLLP